MDPPTPARGPRTQSSFWELTILKQYLSFVISTLSRIIAASNNVITRCSALGRLSPPNASVVCSKKSGNTSVLAGNENSSSLFHVVGSSSSRKCVCCRHSLLPPNTTTQREATIHGGLALSVPPVLTLSLVRALRTLETDSQQVASLAGFPWLTHIPLNA